MRRCRATRALSWRDRFGRRRSEMACFFERLRWVAKQAGVGYKYRWELMLLMRERRAVLGLVDICEIVSEADTMLFSYILHVN